MPGYVYSAKDGSLIQTHNFCHHGHKICHPNLSYKTTKRLHVNATIKRLRRKRYFHVSYRQRLPDTLAWQRPSIDETCQISKVATLEFIYFISRYGWASFRNVSSLISGVSIFCVGAGLSVYHGIMGLINPSEVTSLYWVRTTTGRNNCDN